MLKRLYISNFALIDEMSVDFTNGLTVITGETGAGKSIFLEALNLALGSRADLTTLRDKSKKCVVEAEFESGNQDLKAIFENQQLEYEDFVLLRREISTEGKSRGLLNDSIVNLNVLKQVADKLIDIHSQHQTLYLNESVFQMELVDAFAKAKEKVEGYKTEYKTLCKKQQQLKTLEETEINSKKELDYLNFLSAEFEGILIEPGLLEKLETEASAIENAESIKEALLNANNLISEGELNILTMLNKLKQGINPIAKFNPDYHSFLERVNALQIELKDLSSDFEKAESDVLPDKNKLEVINAQMDNLNRLMKKHHVKTEGELLNIKNELEEKLLGLNSLEGEILKLKKEVAQIEISCKIKAKEISRLRKGVITAIEKQVKETLSDLSMHGSEFKIELNSNEELTANGIDEIQFLFSANKGSALNDLSKVASGGELSRLMLSLKALLATKKKLPTIIFDEIDTGVSGDVANKIGNIMVQMGKHMQVIAITHLPQIACKGEKHLFVYKTEEDEKTSSYIKEVRGEERVVEIAKMLSAGTPTKTAMVNAREMLSLN